MVLSEKTILHVNDIKNALPKEFYSEVSTDFRSAPQSDSLKEQIYFSERKTISDVLAQCNGNRTEAASMLGISTTTLWRKMKALRII